LELSTDDLLLNTVNDKVKMYEKGILSIMNKKFSTSLLMTVLITSLCFGEAQSIFAEENFDEYTLDTMLVTATRTEKRDVDVPASTEIITYEDIVDSGSVNAMEAVSKMLGVDYNTYLPGGSAQTSMTNEINVRGFSYGTLILVNGNPINLNNTYVIDAIPAEAIERIEVVKGGGSVLYGSEAQSGVINIITKKKVSNKVRVGFGNYKQQQYNVAVGNDKLKINYDLKKWGYVKEARYTAANTYTNLKESSNENIGIGYNFNDQLSFEYNHLDTEVSYESLKKDRLNSFTDSSNKQDLIQLNYNGNKTKGHAWFNKTKLDYAGSSARNLFENESFGADLQQNIELNNKSLLTVGGVYKREVYNSKLKKGKPSIGKKARNQMGLFAQLDYKFNDKDNVIIGGRGTWTSSESNGQSYDNFSTSAQYIHKFDQDKSFYVSVAESFVMPSFKQMFPSSWVETKPNPDLKPQEGINYEMGYKEISGNHAWKVALFHMDIKDNISATLNKDDTYEYSNQDFKNTGFEASLRVDASEKFDYDLGLLVHNPKYKWDTDIRNGWHNKFGKYQITGGVGYKIDKFRAKLTGSYIGDRYSSPSTMSYSYKLKPYFLTSLTATYSPDNNSEVSLLINNLLNRSDILSYSNKVGFGSLYTPTNFMLSYTYRF
jgi:tonB-dependent receptor